MKTEQITVKISGSLTALENAAAILNQSFPVSLATGTPRKCDKEPAYFQFFKVAVPINVNANLGLVCQESAQTAPTTNVKFQPNGGYF